MLLNWRVWLAVAEDPGLKLLLLYLEGIPDPWNLAEAENALGIRTTIMNLICF